MSFCLDTNVLIDVMRKRSQVITRLAACEAERVMVSEVVRAELLTGCLKSDHPGREQEKVKHLLSSMELIPFAGEAVEHYALIRAGLESSGQIIGSNDLLIAATARSIGAVLVTANVEEFSRVPGLLVENWR